MPRRNPYDEVVQELKDELTRAGRQADKSRAVPFGQERLSARDARNRYGQMSRGEIEKLAPEQRKDMINLLGVEKVIAQLRGHGG